MDLDEEIENGEGDKDDKSDEGEDEDGEGESDNHSEGDEQDKGNDDEENENENDESANDDGDSDSDSELEADGELSKEEQKPKRRPRTDPTNIYDIDDDFIDDSDFLDANGAPTNNKKDDFWPFGYFAWKGKVENFHEDIVFNDFFEAPRAPAPKKKRGFPVGQTKTTLSKKSADPSPAKPLSVIPPSPTTASALPLPDGSIPILASTTVVASAIPEKKRKRVSTATSTPAKSKNADSNDTTADASVATASTSATATAAPTPKKKKRISGVANSFVATGAAAAATANTVANNNDEAGAVEEEKGKKKALIPLSPAVQVTVNYLKNEREKESFENKKNFPQNLRPPLLEASKIALQNNEMNENFIRHIKKVLPYNSFTLKRLVGRMLLNHAVMQSKIGLTIKTAEFEKRIKELCLAQGIVGPNILEEATSGAAAAGGDTMAAMVVVDKKKFKFDEESKLAIWNILVLEWEQAELENLLATIDGNANTTTIKQHTDANVRKSVYAKLVSFWPQGWMTTVDLSREYSLYKRRINTRVNAAIAAAGGNGGVVAGLDVGTMYIESVANMLAPDGREVYKILKAMKALFAAPPVAAVVKTEEGGEKKEGGSGGDAPKDEATSVA
ncbi:UNVERIFIED_CONTAM: hypothetical protein HDU68_001457 [Siphonaria sp. JEL0065]|nr:hypothetical protein HDU68_001457 [Siphonaria sp. JEL0065]